MRLNARETNLQFKSVCFCGTFWWETDNVGTIHVGRPSCQCPDVTVDSDWYVAAHVLAVCFLVVSIIFLDFDRVGWSHPRRLLLWSYTLLPISILHRLPPPTPQWMDCSSHFHLWYLSSVNCQQETHCHVNAPVSSPSCHHPPVKTARNHNLLPRVNGLVRAIYWMMLPATPRLLITSSACMHPGTGAWVMIHASMVLCNLDIL